MKAFADAGRGHLRARQRRSSICTSGSRCRIDGKTRVTTPGRVLFNQIFPDELEFVNSAMNGGKLRDLVGECHRLLGQEETAEVLDNLKDMGFHYATLGGITIGIDDVHRARREEGDPGPGRRRRRSTRSTSTTATASSPTPSATTGSSTRGRTRPATSPTRWRRRWRRPAAGSTRST